MSEIYQIHLPNNVTYDIKDNSKVPQYSTMPTASSDFVNKVALYIGSTTETYENGYFYKCVENGGLYSWQMQGSASAISELTDVDLTNLSNNDVLVYDDDNDVWVNEEGHLKSVTLTKAQYDALPSAQKNDPHIEYFISDITPLSGMIDDSKTSLVDTWSSNKISGELGDKADIETLKEYEVVESDNYLPNEAKNKVDSRGITFSVNSKDKSVIANGTTTANLYFRIASYFTVPKTGTYKLLGTPPDATGRRELYVFPESTGSAVMADLDGTGATAELIAGVLYGASIYVANGVTLNNKVYKPMLTTNLDATYDDYVKYSLALKDQLKEYEVTPSENLLPTTSVTQAISGNNFVVRDDKTVLVSIPANPTTANFYLLGNTSVLKMTLPAGKYKLIGCPPGGGAYYLQGFGNKDYTTGAGILDTGSGVEFTLTQENELYFFISIRNTFTSGGTLLFKPMVTTNLAATYNDYEPYYLPVKDAMWTKEQQRKCGAYNLCPNEGITQIFQGVTVTVNADLTLSTSGTASANGYFAIFSRKTDLFIEKGKTYKLIDGTENDASVVGVQIFFYDSNLDIIAFYGKGQIFTVPNNTVYMYVAVRIEKGVNFSGKTFKPLITSDLNATAEDYVPYAKTNRELTEDSYGVVTLDGTKEMLAETSASFVSVPSGTETVVVNYTATSNMTGCFIVTGTIVDGNATGYRRIRMRLARTGQQFYFNVYTAPGMVMSSNYQSTTIALPMRLKAGDNVTIMATQDSGSSLRFAGTIEFIGKR